MHNVSTRANTIITFAITVLGVLAGEKKLQTHNHSQPAETRIKAQLIPHVLHDHFLIFFPRAGMNALSSKLFAYEFKVNAGNFKGSWAKRCASWNIMGARARRFSGIIARAP